MNKHLSGVKAAILVANGFDETQMVAAHKMLLEAGAHVRIVSSENGLVNGWVDGGWGHNFAVDAPLGTALGADYGVLVVPGGKRSLEKLNLTAHTKRFVSSFVAAEKPVAVMGDALNIMILTDQIAGRTVAGPADMHDLVLQAGGSWAEGDIHQDGNLMSGAVGDEEALQRFVRTMTEHLSEQSDTLVQAA